MSKLVIHEERCKSCGFCISVCPRNALKSMGQFNQQGYEIVGADQEKCVQCGICYTVCPDYVFELIPE